MAFRWTDRGGARHGRGVSILAALLLGLFAGAPGWAATIERVEVTPERVTIRLDGAAGAAETFLLTAPERIAIDIAGAAPGGSWRGDGAVSRVRQARRGDDGARVVLDLAAPVTVASGQWTQDGRALTLELAPASAGAFRLASGAAPQRWLPLGSAIKAGARYRGASGEGVVQAVPVVAKPFILPRVIGNAHLPLVVLDPGHGGFDPGAINPVTGLREKDVTLKIAKAIRDALVASGEVRVALTRADDRYILHRDRFGMARKLHADLFISIHCDSVGVGTPTGATAYTLSDVASDKEAALLAARENKADVIAGAELDRNADVSNILIDLTQRETMNASAGFARLLGREARPLMPIKDQFHRQASLLVLKAPDMPSILFETGYLSTPQDAAFLDSAAGRKRIAESVKRAVEVYFARRIAMR